MDVSCVHVSVCHLHLAPAVLQGRGRDPLTLLLSSMGHIGVTHMPSYTYTYPNPLIKVEVKAPYPSRGVGGVLISLSLAVEPVGEYTTESVPHGPCDARPMVTFPAAEHHCPLAGTKLYCLVTEAHGCEQHAQSCYLAMHRPGVELATS